VVFLLYISGFAAALKQPTGVKQAAVLHETLKLFN
jgi:hypothetical protein